ncbi:PEP-CTERM sorting domain-containing protein [Aquabacterium sp.]|uniref:PEP-CTERM sorting domain-containing protein n=1 Tax=Aquabacterium sp. TaxID=1872578 RepID=UPI0035B240B9
MKLFSAAAAVAALTLAASAPARADMLVDVLLDFENVSSYIGTTGLPATTVNGVNVTFGNESIGLASDADFNYFTNAPSPLGVLVTADPALDSTADASINVSAGFVNSISFYYSSSVAVSNAVTIWSGLHGTGTVLGTIDLSNNATNGCSDSSFCHFDQLTATFTGVAQSITFSSPSYSAAFDNVSLQAVPEPATNVALLAGLGVLGLVARRRRG